MSNLFSAQGLNDLRPVPEAIIQSIRRVQDYIGSGDRKAFAQLFAENVVNYTESKLRRLHRRFGGGELRVDGMYRLNVNDTLVAVQFMPFAIRLQITLDVKYRVKNVTVIME